MTRNFATTNRWRAAAVLSAALGMAACASDVPPPTAQLGAASQAVQEAERANALQYAQVALQSARDKLAAADDFNLLHDVGDDLTDARTDFLATGVEWRTPPLWGLGLTMLVAPEATFLHDGRARTVAEAILWHGGEAQAAREAFRLATKRDREALLAFLATL